MGRKALSDKAKDAQLRIRLTAEERAAIDAGANAAGQTTSAWARDNLLRLAAESSRPSPRPKPPPPARGKGKGKG